MEALSKKIIEADRAFKDHFRGGCWMCVGCGVLFTPEEWQQHRCDGPNAGKTFEELLKF
jgi:hypothetical protein